MERPGQTVAGPAKHPPARLPVLMRQNQRKKTNSPDLSVTSDAHLLVSCMYAVPKGGALMTSSSGVLADLSGVGLAVFPGNAVYRILGSGRVALVGKLPHSGPSAGQFTGSRKRYTNRHSPKASLELGDGFHSLGTPQLTKPSTGRR